jgi:hypothetical protein
MCAARARAMYDERAKERQKAGGESGGKTAGKGRPKSEADRVPAYLPEAKGNARDEVGKVFGVSGKSVDHATKGCGSEGTALVGGAVR